jgi:hypothetical protein
MRGSVSSARKALVSVSVSLLLAACTGGDGSSSSAAVSPADATEVSAARAVLDAADVADADSLASLQGIRGTAAGTQAAREALDSGVQGDALWAATWVYGTAGTDPSPLLPLLENEDAAVRAMAGAALLSLGEPSAFDALVGLAGDGQVLRGSEPPVSLSRFATATLTRYTGIDLGSTEGASAGDLAAAGATWSAWLDDHRSSLTFDPQTGTWSGG